ncbi:MAG: ABC transporter ATP-binding protein [Clostridia bacterium]|nr:ABC transporter ATP-binding protein [Clostridia bacterium]
MFRRFVQYYRPHRKMFALDMLAALFIALIGMVYPVITNKMLKELIPGRLYGMIVAAGLTVLALYIVRMLLRYFVQYEGHMIGVGMQEQMRSDLFAHLQKLPFSFYDNHETGKIMSRLTSDLFDVSELAHHGPENLFISGIMIIGSFIYLSTIDILLTLIIFTCGLLLAVVAWICRKKMREAFTERRKTTAMINASIESSVTGIRVTKAYTNSDREQEKFEKSNSLFREACRKSYKAMARFHSSTSFITDAFNVVILIAGGLFLYSNRIDFGDYSTFIVSVNLFISPISTLIQFTEQYQNGVTGFARFLEIMDIPPEEDAPDAVEIDRADGNIDIDSISFSYGEGNVIDNITLHVEKGKKLALVGPSGGGKTTLCHLIPAFYPVDEGSISIDGLDIRKIRKESLRRNIGIVQQDVFLFGGTIRENIMYGRLDATEEEMIEAAKRANIHDYVMTLKDGYDSEIGERGVKLSGGQKQRLSIARVFLKNPAILILDEATSALDNTTEILIQQSLDELCKGRTTIVVAHRLSTIRNADEIAVIVDGQIIEQGTHDGLMQKSDGVYKKLYSLQFREGDNTYFSDEDFEFGKRGLKNET